MSARSRAWPWWGQRKVARSADACESFFDFEGVRWYCELLCTHQAECCASDGPHSWIIWWTRYHGVRIPRVDMSGALEALHALRRFWGAAKPVRSNAVMGTLSNEELVVACRNIGFDLSCGQCSSIFFTGTGTGTYEHSESCFTGKRETARVNGDAHCKLCGRTYRDHPMSLMPDTLSYDGAPFLHLGCDGRLLKL